MAGSVDQNKAPTEINRSRVIKKPGVCGGVAIIRGTRIPVWGIISLVNKGADDASLLESFPSINRDDIAAARAYGNLHPMEIDEQIQLNEGD